jgi:hypothetical protein
MRERVFFNLVRYYRLLYKPKFRTKKRYLKIKYVIANLFEQIHAVVPLTLYVILFQYPPHPFPLFFLPPHFFFFCTFSFSSFFSLHSFLFVFVFILNSTFFLVVLMDFMYVVMGVLMHSLGTIIGGQIMVMVGLFLFIEGIKNGLMPLGTKIGNGIPEAVPPWALYIITFITGIIGT